MASILDELARALAAQQAGDFPRAEAGFRLVAGQLLNSLGIVSAQQGKQPQAIASFRQALGWLPQSAAILSNMGNALRLQGDLDQAIECWHRALAIEPNYPDALNNLGLTLLRQGRVAEALASFESALHHRPCYPTAHSNLLLSINYIPEYSLERMFAEHRQFEAAQAPPADAPIFANDRDPSRPLRIGYVSPDLCEHVVGYFLAPILANHDRDAFEVLGYAEVVAPDAMTAHFQSQCQGWRFTTGMDDQALARTIREDRIDILVDLAGHTGNNRLGVFARRAAPVQVTYLGYPNTTGLSTIDYRLTDQVADPPDSRQVYSEKLFRLPGSFCVYQPRAQAPPVGLLPALRTGAIMFGSLNDLAKMNDRALDLWTAVLHAVPGSRLLVLRHTLKGSRLEWLRDQLINRGIQPDRFDLRHDINDVSRYLEVYGEIDICLDVHPWNGHVTTCESLWMGAPVVTLAGDRHAARLSASMLHHIGLDELIARSPEEYIAIAARLSGNLNHLSELRAELRGRMQGLCDGPGFTRQLERAYRAMWSAWCDS